jgi:CTP synthase (UTP-ammonia lyase)
MYMQERQTDTQQEQFRRIGAHEVHLPDGTILHQAVVELIDERVVNYYEFTDELPMTEWLGGTIIINKDYTYVKR